MYYNIPWEKGILHFSQDFTVFNLMDDLDHLILSRDKAAQHFVPHYSKFLAERSFQHSARQTE